MKFTVSPLGDRALCLAFEEGISPEINDCVLCAQRAIEGAAFSEVIETVPTYCTLLVHYRPELASYAQLSDKLLKLLSEVRAAESVSGRSIEIPVCYGGIYGEDLETVAGHSGLTAEEVIRLHTAPNYRVYMLGFLAGFPYLGGLDERLATPRLEKPRIRIAAGSVGIAGLQTGVYPISSPGGWQLIGRTPIKLYDPLSETPALLRAGDTVRFYAISEREFIDLAGDAQTAEVVR